MWLTGLEERKIPSSLLNRVFLNHLAILSWFLATLWYYDLYRYIDEKIGKHIHQTGPSNRLYQDQYFVSYL